MDEDIKLLTQYIGQMVANGKTPADIIAYLRANGFSGSDEAVVRQWNVSHATGKFVPEGTLLAQGRTPSDQTVASTPQREPGADRTAPISFGEAARLAAAGILPGVSDEVIGALRGVLPGGQSPGDAIDEERRILESGRSKAGSGLLEFGSGIGTGLGAAKAAAKGTGALARGVQGFLGLGPKAPVTALGAAGAGARAGGAVGTIAGAGSADNGSLLDRLEGGAVGGATGGLFGGLFGGATTAAMNRFARSAPDAADMQRVFGGDTPEGRRAVRVSADEMRRGGTDPAEALARLRGGDIEPTLPILAADVDPALQAQLARVDLAAQQGGQRDLASTIGETLSDRMEGTAGRQAEALTRATGRRVGALDARVDELTRQRSEVGDIMFARFRRAARTTSPWAKTTNPELNRLLASDELQPVLADVETAMQRGSTSGRLAPKEGYVSPFAADGSVRRTQDPITLSEISRELGERAHKARVAGDRTLASDLFRFKQTIDAQLETFPEFAEANRVMSRLHDYEEALVAGSKVRPRAGVADVKYDLDPFLSQSALDLPEDVAADVARVLDLPEGATALPGARGEVERGAQIQRRAAIEGRSSLLPDNEATREIDELIFGPGPASQMRASTQAERNMSRTAAGSSSARGMLNPHDPTSAQDRSALGSFIRDIFYAGNSPRLGVSLAAGDLARLGLYRAMRPTGAQLGAEATGLLATGDARDAFLRMVQQTQQDLNTPLRRGLLGAGAYAMGGLPDQPR